MSENSLLVESLDKEWEDSDSELLDVVESVESGSSAVTVKDIQNPEDLVKEEHLEEVDPLGEKPAESSSNGENSNNSIDNVNCVEIFVSEISSELVNDNGERSESISNENLNFIANGDGSESVNNEEDSNFVANEDGSESVNNDENSNFTIIEPSLLPDSINLAVGETQRFIVQFHVDEVTLAPDNDFRATPSSDVTTQSEEPNDDRDRITDSPDINRIENKQSTISIKRKRVIKPICQGERSVYKNESQAKKKKSDSENGSNVPSVYSYSEIQRHKKRLTMKALRNDPSSDSDSKSEDSYDPDVDVNLRIFEGSDGTTTEKVIIGEIHCDMVAEDENNGDVNTAEQNRNTNAFTLSTNSSRERPDDAVSGAQVLEIPKSRINEISDQERINKTLINDDEDADDFNTDDELVGLCSLYDDDFFSGNDSDLEILTSKSISRKRSSVPIVRKERTTDSDKRTMYDLIYDTVQPASKSKEKSSDDKSKKEPKKRAPRKTKKNPTTKKEAKTSTESKNSEETVSKKDEKTATETETSNNEKKTEKVNDSRNDGAGEKLDDVNGIVKTNDALPVPQLKVNADGEVIIDTDSLMIEQTGAAEARQAIANGEVIEESGLNYRSYGKKNNFRKQWSPHDTLKFYDVLSVVGTDFTLMATLFPGRTRNCIKRKYKREEKTNRDLIMKALTCKQKFNIGLLEKELKLKEEKVNLLKMNAKKEKQKEKASQKKDGTASQKKAAPAKVKKATNKRKSFFERGISCFQDP